jgi:uncharacterized protein (DUF302 family)
MIENQSLSLGSPIHLDMDIESAVAEVAAALKTEGFGILTEIDVRETLKKKLDVDFRPYKILGACNPSLAYKALSAAPEAGLLLPCNVTVSQPLGGQVEVAIVDPVAMLGVVSHPGLVEIAKEAHQRLERVAALLKKGARID